MIMVRRAHDPNPKSGARFAPGDLVRHRRYGYRGLVVALDQTCCASEDWYQSNNTQPKRGQPWYHVLVHGSQQITYAAQDSLTEEPDPAPVHHPLVEVFFSEYEGVRYVRNERPWELG